MLALFAFLSKSKFYSSDDYLFWGHTSGFGIEWNSDNMFKDNYYLRPGIKLYYNNPVGGVEFVKKKSNTIRNIGIGIF